MNTLKKLYNSAFAAAYKKQIPRSDRVSPERLLEIQRWMLYKGICVDGRQFFTPQKKSVVQIVENCQDVNSIRPLTRAERRKLKTY